MPVRPDHVLPDVDGIITAAELLDTVDAIAAVQLPDGHIPDGFKIDVDGNFWITAVAGGGVDVIDRNGKFLHFVETGGTILNCCFGKGGRLFCCDMGPFDTSGAAMTGRLVEVDLGVEGMPLFRGAIG
jgi:gluconolactonase